MSIFDVLFRRGPTEEPFTGSQPERPNQTPVDPLPSFIAMELDIERTATSADIGDPIQPCTRPWLELSLFDADGRPIPNAPYKLSIPGASGRSGNLDDRGFVRLQDVAVDAVSASVLVEVEQDEEGNFRRYHLVVVSEPTAVPGGEEEEPEAEAPLARIEFETLWKFG